MATPKNHDKVCLSLQFYYIRLGVHLLDDCYKNYRKILLIFYSISLKSSLDIHTVSKYNARNSGKTMSINYAYYRYFYFYGCHTSAAVGGA